MATITCDTTTPLLTVGQLLETIADVPPSRIRLVPPPGTATEDDVLAVHAKSKLLCELVDGVLVEKVLGFEEAIIAPNIAYEIRKFLETHDLGVIAGADGMLRLELGVVRIPDVTFISWSQLPGRKFPPYAIWRMPPTLAVEVLSEGNTQAEITRKIGEYFAAGTQQVWIVDPKTRSVDVFKGPSDVLHLTSDGQIDGGEVLPGFRLPLASIFRHALVSRRDRRP